MSWFTSAEARIVKTEAELALEMVKLSGDALVAAVVKAAEVAGKKLLAQAYARAEAEVATVSGKLVAEAKATAQAAVAAATASATPAP